jgi:hypothetical protein
MSRALGASAFVALSIVACAPYSGTKYEDGGAAPGSDAEGDATAGASADGAIRATDAATTDVTNPGDATTADSSVDDLYGRAVLADKPLIYYRLEEASGATMAISAAPNTPAATIDPTPGYEATGRVGFAFDFSAANGADLDQPAAGFDFLGNASFSAEVWMYANMIDNTYRHAFTKDTIDQAGGRQEWGVWVQNGNVGFERYVDGIGSKVTTPLTTKAWHHVVAVYDGSNLSLYVDGANKASTADNRGAKMKDKDLIMGARDRKSGGGAFPGIVDELAVYDHALAATRIAAHYALAP